MYARLSFLLCCLSLLAACTITPRHEFDPAVDFGRYQSYSWKAPDYGDGKVSDPILDSELLGRRVEAAVDAELQARGFRRSTESPDMIVTYHTSKDFEYRRSGPRFSVGIHQGYGHFHTGLLLDDWGTMKKEGVLIVDIIDAESSELVWRGWRELPLVQEYFNSERVNSTVASILSAFPPGSNSPGNEER